MAKLSYFVAFVFLLSAFISGLSIPESRPAPSAEAAFARWMVGNGRWGVLATLDPASRRPFGNVVSYADAGTGSPYFYLTTRLDPTGAFAVANPLSSFTLSEIELGTCDPAITDPQSPICAKITVSGDLKRLPENSNETMFALDALYASHPQFRGFPRVMGFEVFKLEVETIFLVNDFKPFVNVSVEKYFNIN